MTAPTTNDYLNLSQAAYTVNGLSPTAPTGWTLIGFSPQNSYGMQAAAFQNSSGAIVIAYEGTNGGNLDVNNTMLEEHSPLMAPSVSEILRRQTAKLWLGLKKSPKQIQVARYILRVTPWEVKKRNTWKQTRVQSLKEFLAV